VQSIYYLRRSAFISILEREARQGRLAPRIHVMTSANVSALRRAAGPPGRAGATSDPAAAAGPGGGQAQLAVDVEVSGSGGGQQGVVTLRPRLVVAADGMNSLVRRTLEEWEGAGRFGTVRRPSAAAGLRFKVGTHP
jgi:2-polyprenyl-6-methoxyphenol hydroxylase-like FAD-dependent oxidoreductase